MIIPSSLVFQVTDTNKVVSNRNLDTIVHVASNQNTIDSLKRRIEELEFHQADLVDELNEIHKLCIECRPSIETERKRSSRVAENVSQQYQARMNEISHEGNSCTTQIDELKQQLMLEQQKADLECRANPPVLLTGEDILANYYSHMVQEF